MINHNALLAAQSKLVIARFLGDGVMWSQAMDSLKMACEYPLLKNKSDHGFIAIYCTCKSGDK